MVIERIPLAPHLRETSRIGSEISITGKWIPKRKGSFLFRSEDSKDMAKEWEQIHQEAKSSPGVLSTEINPAIGEEAVLVHHTFKDQESLTNYFQQTASTHALALMNVAQPEVHLIRGLVINDPVKKAIQNKVPGANFSEYLFGYVKDDYRRPDPSKAIQVTAKWTCAKDADLDELIHWWQMVGTDAFELEKGLLRFEVYQVPNEPALIIHETFEDSTELKFHLTKGTAARYKKELDAIAAPENYFFRGPVSWTIRTYSKFMKLPATYTRGGKQFISNKGSWSDGIILRA